MHIQLPGSFAPKTNEHLRPTRTRMNEAFQEHRLLEQRYFWTRATRWDATRPASEDLAAAENVSSRDKKFLLELASRLDEDDRSSL
jgi:hypothetical protein